MTIVLENCIEEYKVRETTEGLDVYDGDKIVCELEGYSLHDFHDEWGNVDEDELLAAIEEELDLQATMEKSDLCRRSNGRFRQH